ncbi:YIP1 family protein [Candidatus Woesearchaeota archaeon]|nr:YIP1 family protein [Candidatus Woesearchaeota archaeon]
MANQVMRAKPIRQSGQKPAFNNQFDKLKKLFFSPKAFFEGVAGEKEYFPPLIYFVIILVIAQFTSVLLSIPSALQQPTGGLAVVFSFFGIAVAAGIGFAIPFISSGINHLGVLIFGGRKGYYNTFKPTTYAMVIGVVYGFFINIANFILSIVQPLELPATPPASFSGMISLIPVSYLAVNAVLYLASMVHTLYTQVIGISRYQGISKLRAFLAIMLMMLIMALIIGVVMLLFFKLITTIGAAAP